MLLILLQFASWARSQDFEKRVIYQVVTDRFFNGDLSNDNCPQSAGLFDATHTQWRLYWGGDLEGIQDKLPYLKAMGVTAIWISPPVDNINVAIRGVNGQPATGYHGYWARDFMRIEEHFGDCRNSWTAFDNLAAAAHRDGIKMIVDFAANDTSDRDAGAYGALYDDGKFMADYRHDPHGYFHHNPSIRQWNNAYQLQYYTLFNLADLNQENPVINTYLKTALRQFQQHGADAFRLDAVKHVTWGWEYSLADAAHTLAPSFLFGEWMERSVDDPLYPDSVKFANRSGISLLDYPLAIAVRNVFSGKAGFPAINDTLREEDRDFSSPNALVTFIDNQDLPRLMTMKHSRLALNQALAFILTCRGVPIVYYGDEQYLHNDTNGGNDPYNRNWMSAWSTHTRAYRLIQDLARLRSTNDALAYGSFRERWISSDVYIYERRFSQDVVLIAINKNSAKSYRIRGLDSALPPGTYADYLGGLLSGARISITPGKRGGNTAKALILPPGSVSVWVSASAAARPEAGSIGPTVGQPGMKVSVAGQGFGTRPGTVLFDVTPVPVTSWSSTSVTFLVPHVANGMYHVRVEDDRGRQANAMLFTVLEAPLIPVRFTVRNAKTNQPGDQLYLTGNTVELGDWGTRFSTAAGPMLDPHYPNWFLCVSVPACHTIQFKFFDVQPGGKVVWENGPNYSYRVPCKGVGSVSVNWRHGVGR